MDRQTVLRIVIALLVIAAIAGVGVYEYRLGVAHGIATSGKFPAGAPGVYPYPHWGWGFHPFGFVFPLLFLFLIFGLGRRFLWGGWGRSARLARRRIFRGSREMASRGPRTDVTPAIMMSIGVARRTV
jgi:hypothetical protein